jgi:hypothetical protein
MTGTDAILALKKKLSIDTDSALAQKLGTTAQRKGIWKKSEHITERQLSDLVHKAWLAGSKSAQASALRPIVEFFPITRTAARQKNVHFNLMSTKASNGGSHAYMSGLRQELDTHSGVYLFFDRRGQAICAGKAKTQSLWKEMNNAFNRKRQDVHRIRRVAHPLRNQPYTSSKEKSRQTVQVRVPLHELASYFSAYEVTPGMINEIEALLVRSFANDLLNKRMEKLGHQQRGWH